MKLGKQCHRQRCLDVKKAFGYVQKWLLDK